MGLRAHGGIPTSPNDTKAHIVIAALALFAEQGVASVSLRQVNRCVGTRNNSAAHYHFGDKDKLMESVLQFIQDWFEKCRERPLLELENKASTGNVSVRDIIEVWTLPYVKVVRDERWGADAIKLLARIQLEHDSLSRELHRRVAERVLSRLKTIVLQSIPDIPQDIVLHRLSYCIYSFVQGLAVSAFMLNVKDPASIDGFTALCKVAVDFCVGGMLACSSITPGCGEFKILSRINLLF